MAKYDVGELITALNEAVNKLNNLRAKYNDLEKERDALKVENERLQAILLWLEDDLKKSIAGYDMSIAALENKLAALGEKE